MFQVWTKLRLYGVRGFASRAIFESWNIMWQRAVKGSFSQRGEDMVIDRLLGWKKRGFYVDVGAYHPVRFSNSQRFFLRGWRGINIEPDPNNFRLFGKLRRGDKNLNVGVGCRKSKQKFYFFSPSTLSTFSKIKANEYSEQGFKIVGQREILVESLKSILKEYAGNKPIDFLSVDTEGTDLEVLKSNDWRRFRPKVICIETSSRAEALGDRRKYKAVDLFLRDVGYRLFLDNGLNSIFVSKGCEAVLRRDHGRSRGAS